MRRVFMIIGVTLILVVVFVGGLIVGRNIENEVAKSQFYFCEVNGHNYIVTPEDMEHDFPKYYAYEKYYNEHGFTPDSKDISCVVWED